MEDTDSVGKTFVSFSPHATGVAPQTVKTVAKPVAPFATGPTRTSSLSSEPPPVDDTNACAPRGNSGSTEDSSVDFGSRTTVAPLELPRSLYTVLAPYAIPFDELDTRHRAYRSLIKLVRELISVAPNAAPVLEIWPPAFSTYNVLVPGLLNLPFLLWGVTIPRHLIGIGMYYSSRSHGCMYCSLHSCLFSLRRGTSPESIQGTSLSTQENIVARTAFNLAAAPCRLTDADRAAMRSQFSSSTEEYLVSAMGMMGFLNRMMNTLRVPMEASGVTEALPVLGVESSGWHTEGNNVVAPQSELQQPRKKAPRKDTLKSNLALVKHFPSAIAFENEMTKGVPSSWPKLSTYLFEKTGHTWPVLSRLKHSRTVVSLATILVLNLDACESSLEMEIKYFAGMIFAACLGNQLLFDELRKITLNMCPELPKETLDGVQLFAWDRSTATCNFDRIRVEESPLAGIESLSHSDCMMLFFAKASSSNPAQSPPSILEIADVVMTKPQVVEMVTWLSVCNLIHRLECYYMPESFIGARSGFDDWGDLPM